MRSSSSSRSIRISSRITQSTNSTTTKNNNNNKVNSNNDNNNHRNSNTSSDRITSKYRLNKHTFYKAANPDTKWEAWMMEDMRKQSAKGAR